MNKMTDLPIFVEFTRHHNDGDRPVMVNIQDISLFNVMDGHVKIYMLSVPALTDNAFYVEESFDDVKHRIREALDEAMLQHNMLELDERNNLR